jgi:hypothetical protein
MELTPNPETDKHRAYRRRLAAKGWRQFIGSLPSETLAFVDELKDLQGLPNRSLVLLELVEEKRRATAQQ